jgi:hypothetical protein
MAHQYAPTPTPPVTSDHSGIEYKQLTVEGFVAVVHGVWAGADAGQQAGCKP